MLARAARVLFPLMALLASLASWPFMPDPMPIHWGLDGQPDGFAPRAVGLLLLPGVALGLPMLIGFFTRRDASLGPKARRALERTLGATAVLLSVLHVLALFAAWTEGPLAVGAVAGLLGALFLVLGASMRDIEPNRWIGVRTPATLRDPAIWKVVHEKSATAFVLAGGASVLAAIFLPAAEALMITIVASVAVGVGTMLFAWALGRARPG
jgi:uncharacterized membrane protein